MSREPSFTPPGFDASPLRSIRQNAESDPGLFLREQAQQTTRASLDVIGVRPDGEDPDGIWDAKLITS